MKQVRLYIEGGGSIQRNPKGSTSRNPLAPALRIAYRAFLKHMIAQLESIDWEFTPILGGGRSETFNVFENDPNRDASDYNALLVDSESAVPQGQETLDFLANSTNWPISPFSEKQCYLMVQSLESWLLADPTALQHYYGNRYSPRADKYHQNIELISPATADLHLRAASRRTDLGAYRKGRDEAPLLERINPQLVRQKSPHCERLFTELPAAVAKL